MNIDDFKDAVDAGKFDSSLSEMITYLQNHQRRQRVSRTIDDYNIGDRVKFNSLTGTKYMVGVEATIVGKKQKKVVVRPDSAVGRFGRLDSSLGKVIPVDVTCPVAILDLV